MTRQAQKLPESEYEVILGVNVLDIDLDHALEQVLEQLFRVADEEVGLLRIEIPRRTDQKRDGDRVLFSFDDELGGDEIVKSAAYEASDENVVAGRLRLVLALE